jgi:hypothetical protein
MANLRLRTPPTWIAHSYRVSYVDAATFATDAGKRSCHSGIWFPGSSAAVSRAVQTRSIKLRSTKPTGLLDVEQMTLIASPCTAQSMRRFRRAAKKTSYLISVDPAGPFAAESRKAGVPAANPLPSKALRNGCTLTTKSACSRVHTKGGRFAVDIVCMGAAHSAYEMSARLLHFLH